MAEEHSGDKTQSEKFYRFFRDELSHIDEKINALPQFSAAGGERGHAIDQCYAAINSLSDEAIKASIYLAPHDRRTYAEAINGLRQRLTKTQDAINGKKKFSFKSGGSRRTNVIDGEDAGQSASKTEDTPAKTTLPPNHPPSTRKALDLDKHHSQHLQIPSYKDSEACSGSIVNVKRCVIDKKMANDNGKGTPLASLTLQDISESLIICGSIDGPIHLTSISDSVIVVASHQFRMHQSRRCDVYLHTSSRPIIEDCEGIRFAPLPAVYKSERLRGTEDQWREVDDFNWHRLDPSPNWSVLPAEERIQDDVWRDVVPGRPLQGAEEILRALTIVKKD